MTATVLPVPREELDLLVRGEHGHPHAVLGPHPHDGGVTVRVLKPLASSVVLTWGDERLSLEHEHEGVWVGVVPAADVPDYRLEVAYDGSPWKLDDPYRFLPTLGEVDLHLINEGRHERLWDVLGAHVRHYPGALEPVTGTSFAVWAPRAGGVVGALVGGEGELAQALVVHGEAPGADHPEDAPEVLHEGLPLAGRLAHQRSHHAHPGPPHTPVARG